MSFGKNRQWWGTLYPENMPEDWRERLETKVQLPYAYCIHDKGLQLENGDHRKVHMHLIIVWPSPTTHKHAREVFDQLSAPGRNCTNGIEPVYSAKNAYDYLIHDTEDCRKKGKYQFPKCERITGNNYDIGAYVQISVEEKNEIFDELTEMCLRMKIVNYADFVVAARDNFPDRYDVVRDVIRASRGHFESLTRGIYLRGDQIEDPALHRASYRSPKGKKKEKMQKGGTQPSGSAPAGRRSPGANEGGLAK